MTSSQIDRLVAFSQLLLILIQFVPLVFGVVNYFLTRKFKSNVAWGIFLGLFGLVSLVTSVLLSILWCTESAIPAADVALQYTPENEQGSDQTGLLPTFEAFMLLSLAHIGVLVISILLRVNSRPKLPPPLPNQKLPAPTTGG